jgi:HEAT repeat protein
MVECRLLSWLVVWRPLSHLVSGADASALVLVKIRNNRKIPRNRKQFNRESGAHENNRKHYSGRKKAGAMLVRALVDGVGATSASTVSVDAIVCLLADSDERVRNVAMDVLSELNSVELTPHACTIVSMLADSRLDVRLMAVRVLGWLELDVLSVHAGSIARLLEDTEPDVRCMAVKALGRPDALSSNVGVVVLLLVDPIPDVRRTAVHALEWLDQVALKSHAGAIAGSLTDPVTDVRCTAIRALGNLERSALALYADAIARLLEDTEPHVRCTAMRVLGKLEHGVLASYSGVIANCLMDTVPYVCCMAVETLGNLDRMALAPHIGGIADAIFRMLVDPDATVRCNALRMFYSVAMGMQTPSLLVMACDNVTNMLTDADYGVRDAADIALCNLKRKLVRLRWANVCAFVHLVRPYAIFWYAYAGEQLCAPGGKWAARDRIAFEEDFDELCN